MNIRKKVLFKVNNEVVVEESGEIELTEIERMKLVISQELDCTYDDVEVEYINLPLDISEIDVDSQGLFDWREPYPKIITGVKLTLIEGSDEYLDALSNGSLETFLIFN